MTRRKSRRKWWTGLRRSRPYLSQIHLHRYEDEIIMRRARELADRTGGVWTSANGFTAEALCNTFPDSFNRKHLPRALKRMAGANRLKARKPWGRKPVYTIIEPPEEAIAA